MRTASAILAFFILLTGIRPFLPVAEYMLHKDFYAKYLCINRDKPEMKCEGKCHLSTVLEENLPADEGPPAVLEVQESPVFLPAGISYPTSHRQKERAFNPFKPSLLSNELTSRLFRPPRMACFSFG